MADEFLASNEFPGNGVTTLFNVAFKGNRPDAESGTVPYLNPADVKAQQITPATATTPESVIDLTCTPVGPNQFNVTPVVPTGKIVRIYRATQDEYNLVDYQSLQTVGEADLDLANRQTIFIVQEAHDLAVRASLSSQDANEVAFDAVGIAMDAAADAATALTTANTALSTANSAVNVANNAAADAASAEAHADSADAAASAAQTAANTANTNASTALSTANAANATANTALTTANGIASTANAALAASTDATNTANTALSVANGIAATANNALVVANQADTTANSALATANAISGTANTALANSNTAISTANAANSTANTALTNANNALTVANTKQAAHVNLSGLSSVTSAADRLAYFSGTSGLTSLATFTPYGRTLLALNNAAALKANIGPVVGRNVLINGEFRVAQRGSSVTTSGTGTFYGGPDRWVAVSGGAGGSFSQFATTITEGGIPKRAIAQQVVTPPTSLATTNYWSGISQRVEGQNAQQFRGKPAVLSFLFHSNKAGPFSACIRDGGSTQSFVQNFSITAGVATRIEIAVPTFPTAAVIAEGAGIGFEIQIGASNNDTYVTGTIGAWQAGIKMKGSHQWPTAVSDFIAVAEVQLEVGTVKSDFEFMNFGDVLMQCQRYMEDVGGTVTPANGLLFHRPYKVVKRAIPSLTLVSGGLGGADFDTGASNLWSMRAPASVAAAGAADFVIRADCEL